MNVEGRSPSRETTCVFEKKVFAAPYRPHQKVMSMFFCCHCMFSEMSFEYRFYMVKKLISLRGPMGRMESSCAGFFFLMYVFRIGVEHMFYHRDHGFRNCHVPHWS